MNVRPGKWHPSLRARLALMSAAAVAIAIAAVSALAWWATAKTMRAQVDQTLTTAPMSAGVQGDPAIAGASQFGPEKLCSLAAEIPATLQPGSGSIQILRSDGTICAPAGAARIPVTAQDVAAANGGSATPIRDATTSC